jgi:hypothetical protein
MVKDVSRLGLNDVEFPSAKLRDREKRSLGVCIGLLEFELSSVCSREALSRQLKYTYHLQWEKNHLDGRRDLRIIAFS